MSRRALLSLLLAVACGDNLAPFEPTGEVPTGRTLFAGDRIWDVEIDLDPVDIAALDREPFEYVQADVRVGGLALPDAGVRLKGTFSFRPLSGKAAFKIRTDWMHEGQTIDGIRRLTLNNMWQSRGMVSEWLGYQVFAAAGVPSPRCAFARVWVNGELYGLYASVETEDEVFLARHFADATGNLYEAELTDITADEIADFEQEQGEDTSRTDLAELAAAVAAPGDDLFFADPSLLDTGEFLAFVAGEAVVGHWDGYWKAHNYRLYRDPASGRWSFIPWGIDQAYERRLDPFAGAGLVTRKCMASPRCLALYAGIARALTAEVALLDLPARLDAVLALIDESIERDPRKPYGTDKVRRHQAAIRDYLVSQTAALAQRLACADEDGELDEDGDGAGACLEDCDDTSAAAAPGLLEVCDGLDNDCNGKVDDLAGCGCESEEVGEAELSFCPHPMPWSDARLHCAAQGAELAWFDGADQARLAFASARARVRDHWYFALNDRVEESVWRDPAEPVSFEDWASDEPDSFGDEDCGVLDLYASGAWSDVRCGEPHPFICRAE
ncbi:MAG TPA: CotH kinase family protein [Kofleriaceae bacterium]|nr:CotH kinase family protein [Kofleriaceae bacterium]